MSLVGSAFSIQHPSLVTRALLGGEAEPTRPLRRREFADGHVELVDEYAFRAIESPELRAAFMAAHYAWAKKTAPWLLERWLDD